MYLPPEMAEREGERHRERERETSERDLHMIVTQCCTVTHDENTVCFCLFLSICCLRLRNTAAQLWSSGDSSLSCGTCRPHHLKSHTELPMFGAKGISAVWKFSTIESVPWCELAGHAHSWLSKNPVFSHCINTTPNGVKL